MNTAIADSYGGPVPTDRFGRPLDFDGSSLPTDERGIVGVLPSSEKGYILHSIVGPSDKHYKQIIMVSIQVTTSNK